MTEAAKALEGELLEGPKTGKTVAKRKNGSGDTKHEVAVADGGLSEGAAWLQTIERLAPSIGIEGVRELMTMRREEQARLAEREFSAAMAMAQAELIPVSRNQKNKQTGSNYADLAALAEAAMPIIHAHGFGATTSEFESKKPDHLGVALDVSHRSGHSKHYEFNIPLDGAGIKGNRNMTPTHAYASTLSYGERYAKCKVFGIATKDDDGNAAGAKPVELINADQVEKLKSSIMDADANLEKFLRFFKIETLEGLPASQYGRATSMLDEKKGRAE